MKLWNNFTETLGTLQKAGTQVIAAVGVFVSRLHVLPANVSPMGSFGFFGSPWLFLATVVSFDMFVGGFYQGFWWTYLGFTAYPVLGRLARHHVNLQVVLLPLASLLFFAISNFGVWWAWYDHTWQGLLACYSLALPFYQRTLIGDVVFGYGYLGLKSVLPWLKVKSLTYGML